MKLIAFSIFLLAFFLTTASGQSTYIFKSKSKKNSLIFSKIISSKDTVISIDNLKLHNSILPKLIYQGNFPLRCLLLRNGAAQLIDSLHAPVIEYNGQKFARKNNLFSTSNNNLNDDTKLKKVIAFYQRKIDTIRKNAELKLHDQVDTIVATKDRIIIETLSKLKQLQAKYSLDSNRNATKVRKLSEKLASDTLENRRLQQQLDQANNSNSFANVIAIFGILFGSGVIVFLIKWLREKTISMILIGETGVGKSTIFDVMKFPDQEKKNILNKRLTDTFLEEPLPSKEVKGGFFYKYIPNVIDIPGRLIETQSKEIILKKNDIIIFVVSFTQHNSSADFQETFITKQLDFIRHTLKILDPQILVKRPRLLVFYISKFDLLVSSDTLESLKKEQMTKLEKCFDEHIRLFKTKADALGIPHKIYFGSSTDNWYSTYLFNDLILNLKQNNKL